jgi:hypothetical protein
MSNVLQIQGTVTRSGRPVEAAYIDLIDPDGLFVAERRTGPDGRYSFHTTPGSWSLAFRVTGAEAIRREVQETDDSEVIVDLELPES